MVVITRELNESDSSDSSDATRLAEFLARHADSSMILRSNLVRAGLTYRGALFEAQYFAAFRAGEMVAVVAHSWSGMLLLQAPEYAAELARSAVLSSGRKVTGVLGPLEQVGAAREALALHGPVQRELNETLFALELANLIVPRRLETQAVVCRTPLAEDRVTLVEWRRAYEVETLGAIDSVEHRAAATRWVDAQIADGGARVATANGVLVSLSAVSAALPEMVQLGGIYTPPEHRGRGYARAVTAAILLAARERGVRRGLLFSSNPSAIRCYAALGFGRVGDYGIVLLA